MITHTQQRIEVIKLVAYHLSEKFTYPLFELSKEKNYSVHIGVLAEILDWSREFYDLYYNTINEWEVANWNSHHSYNNIKLEGLIIKYGQCRLKRFYDHNMDYATYFLERYSSIKFSDSEKMPRDLAVLEGNWTHQC